MELFLSSVKLDIFCITKILKDKKEFYQGIFKNNDFFVLKPPFFFFSRKGPDVALSGPRALWALSWALIGPTMGLKFFCQKSRCFEIFFTMLNFQLFFTGTKFSIKFDKKKTVSRGPVAVILENFWYFVSGTILEYLKLQNNCPPNICLPFVKTSQFSKLFRKLKSH